MSEVQESPAAADDSVHHSGQSYVDPPPTPLLDANELKLWSLYRALMAEFIATLLFLYITVATIIGHTLQNAADPCDGVGVLGIAWAFGGTFFVLVYCTAGISGGHINPAVTFAMLLARKVSLIRALAYIIAQCAGATSGAALVRALTGTDGLALVRAFMGTDGADFVIHGYKISTGLGAQIIGSFVLVYFVFSATDPKRNARDSHVSVLAPLPIGFAVFMVYLGTSSITGTGINPAWSFAVAAVFHSHNIWDDHWIYWAGPFLGALIAAAYHQYVLRAFSIASSFRTTSDDDDESIH